MPISLTLHPFIHSAVRWGHHFIVWIDVSETRLSIPSRVRVVSRVKEVGCKLRYSTGREMSG